MKRPACVCGVLFFVGILVGRYALDASFICWAGAGACPKDSIPGDVNADGAVNVSDAVVLLKFLFRGDDPPVSCCAEEVATNVVFLLRHAERDGGINAPLNKAGRERAQALAQVFERVGIDTLIASDLRRTQETLEPLAADKGLDISITASRSKEGAIEVVRLIDALMPGQTAVVAHHSFTIPAILDELGLGAARISGNDQMWILFLRAGEPVQHLELTYPGTVEE